MKNLLKYIATACLGIISLNSCSDDDSIIKLNPASFVAPKVTSTATTAELTEATQSETAFVFEWTAADYGINTTINYSIEIAKQDDTFENAKVLSSTQNTSYEVSGTALNALIVDQLQIPAEEEVTVQYRVVASLGTFGSEPLISDVRTITLTPFSTDLSTPWGIVGTINNWGNTGILDTPFWKTKTPDVLEAFVTLVKDDAIKFRKNNEWNGDFGGSGAPTLTPNGFEGTLGGNDIIVPTPGNYKITLDLNNNTYKAELFQWGLVGSATPNGWDGPDLQILTFDGINEVWYANNIILKDGLFKIRQNSDWGTTNYGLGSSSGTLSSDNGKDIPVEAGTYNLVVDFNKLTYSLTPVQK